MNKPAHSRGFHRFFRNGCHIAGLCAAALAVVSCDEGSKSRHPGQTDFTTLDNGSGSARHTGAAQDSAGSAPGTSAPTAVTPAPQGRTGTVQEADIYRLSGSRLFYLNTYRGFMVYDVSNTQQPVKVSSLPVYGYPVEMFVEGNTIYALLRDALYLTEVGGQLQFQRHYVSQLVTIDVSDLGHPRILKTLDIIGELHEGVSRKIDNTIYVVSEQFGGYYWGWVTPDVVPTEQAWVYSYDVSDPVNPRQAGQLQIFEGGNTQNQNSSRYFGGVSISATSNALMVVENWNAYGTAIGPCGWGNTQDAVVSVYDISDPTGNIRLHTRFGTTGNLDDQFKMTYRFDEATQRGTFFGIFGRQSWNGCNSGAVTQNTLESWDITNGASPQRLASLDFGKPGEAVRGTAFDLSRNVAYAITARQVDPLYAIDITDPAAPRVASAIDGLSGSVSVFRTVAGGQFLLGVGTDTSSACDGSPDPSTGWANTKMALTIVDVRDLANIRLVQRQCIAIQNAEWTWSSLTWNLDQAHKMLGMFQDGDLNVLTVPVSYYTRQDANGVDVGWWYQWKTAVGLLTWDLSRYDPSKPPEQQTVVRSYGTFVHPEGEVNRSILFRHPVSGARTMINLSDTHLSVANIDDLAQPRLESIVEVAPPVNEIFGFGNYLVERVDLGQGYWSMNGMAEFRVKRAGGDVDDKAPVATFRIGQATAAYPYKKNLVVLRYQIDDSNNPSSSTTTEAIVYDLSDPTHPRLASRLTVPFQSFRYWGFFCGVDFWGGYWFGGGSDTIVTDAGLVQMTTDYEWNGSQTVYKPHLALLDLRNPAAPAVDQIALDPRNNWSWFSLVSDPAAPAGFYLSRRDYLGQENTDGGVFSRYRDYAQRWEAGSGHLVAGADINVPGPLARTWISGGTRLFLTNENVYRTIQFPDRTEWHGDTRLNLLKQTGSLAELLDEHTFVDLDVSSLIVDNSNHLFVAAQRQYYWWGYADLRAANPPSWESTSDRLMTFDLGARTLRSIFDQPIRTNYSQLMGLHGQDLFLSLPGDGVLMINVADPAKPSGVRFVRTLGWGSHLDFVGNDGYVAAGNFGSFNIDLTSPPTLAAE